MNLKYLPEQRITIQDQQVWLSKLLGYDFEIIYKQGSSYRIVDALSQRKEERELNGITKSYWLDAMKINEEFKKDSYLSKIIEDLKRDPHSHKHYALKHGRLLYKGRLVLATNFIWIPKLL